MKRIRRRTNRRGLSVSIIILLLVTAAYVLGWSSLFTVKSVDVQGVPNKIERNLIRESVTLGAKMARLEPRSVTNSLHEFSWIDHADVSRNWLKGVVTIRVSARIPIAAYRGRLIDSSATLFNLPKINKSRLPIISTTSNSYAKFAVEVLMQLPKDLRSNVAELLARSAHSVTLKVRDVAHPNRKIITVIWGGLSDTTLKMRVMQALLDLPENSKISTINVSAPHAPIVK